MTNREKYGELVLDTLCMGKGLALKDGKPVSCDDMPCEMCDWCDKECSSSEIALWLNAEYVDPQVDWSTVAVDTKILVKDGDGPKWLHQHFAGYKGGKVFAYQDGHTSWTSNDEPIDWEYAKLDEEAQHETD